jgi:hypothetical protein
MLFPADSPLADKLHTNYVPSDAELELLLAFLVEPKNELARIDAQINELMVERSSLSATIDAHKALISPMRRVPEDILCEVFIACLPTAHNALIDADEAPMLLGRIFRHWRAVAYSTPRLWASLHVPVVCPSRNSQNSQSLLDELEKAVEAWLDLPFINCSLPPTRLSCSSRSGAGNSGLASYILPPPVQLHQGPRAASSPPWGGFSSA